jgi:hypothetical protein
MIYRESNIEDKLRMSICITAPPETKVEGVVGKMVKPM